MFQDANGRVGDGKVARAGGGYTGIVFKVVSEGSRVDGITAPAERIVFVIVGVVIWHGARSLEGGGGVDTFTLGSGYGLTHLDLGTFGDRWGVDVHGFDCGGVEVGVGVVGHRGW